MEPISIELKLISCKDLRAFNFFQKLTVYALVTIATDDPTTHLTDEESQPQRTQTDRGIDSGDGTNPEWNHEAHFDLGFLSKRGSAAVDGLFLRFEFRHDGVILGDKLLGECRVPLADLIRDVTGVKRFVSYEVRSGEGKPNGTFNFAYRLVGIGNHSSQILNGSISGYPVLAPEDYAPAQYPKLEIENPCCYDPVYSVQEGTQSTHYPPAVAPQPPPPPVPFPPSGDCYYYYPPPPPEMPRPPYPYPPPPRPEAQPYMDFRPGPNPWPPGPYFEHRW